MTMTGLDMCELLAMSSSLTEQLTFSLRTLASRGGHGSNTHDGWGVAFYQGDDVALFREPAAAADSALVQFLATNGPSTHLAISHIRHATQGTVQLSNTQPFVRELGGGTHVFAHNGNLVGIENSAEMKLGSHRPVGQTDSEHAFCALLARLQPLWKDSKPPSFEARLKLLTKFASDLRTLGPANFLYADGDVLFAHGHRRIQHENGQIEPPGLWILERHCSFAETPVDTPADNSADHQGGLAIKHADQSVVLFASVPLTAEAWRPLTEGELLVVRTGKIVQLSV